MSQNDMKYEVFHDTLVPKHVCMHVSETSVA